MHTPARTIRTEPRGAQSLRQHLTILVVIAQAEFKLKYAGSALGYLWSVLKPLALFTMMYLVFGRIFKLGELSQYYPLALLIGIVLFTFFSDSSIMGMSSLVSRESLLRKLIFPRVIIPTAATLTAAMTFAVNTIVIGGFVAWNHLVPQLDWVLIVPLLLELYIFVLGIALILSTLFVRFRDIGQIWELVLQLFFYASPIIYPIGYLPAWARNIAFLNPFTQVLQGIRALVIYPEDVATATTALGTYGRLIPVGIAFATFGIGLWLFKRHEPFFAERV